MLCDEIFDTCELGLDERPLEDGHEILVLGDDGLRLFELLFSHLVDDRLRVSLRLVL